MPKIKHWFRQHWNNQQQQLVESADPTGADGSVDGDSGGEGGLNEPLSLVSRKKQVGKEATGMWNRLDL